MIPLFQIHPSNFPSSHTPLEPEPTCRVLMDENRGKDTQDHEGLEADHISAPSLDPIPSCAPCSCGDTGGCSRVHKKTERCALCPASQLRMISLMHEFEGWSTKGKFSSSDGVMHYVYVSTRGVVVIRVDANFHFHSSSLFVWSRCYGNRPSLRHSLR